MHSEDTRDGDAAQNIITLDITTRRAALRTRFPTLISRRDGASAAPIERSRHPVRPVPHARAAAAVAAARTRPVIRPRRAADAVAVPGAEPTDVFWRAPGRHRAPEAPRTRRLSRWHRWPWSIGVDSLIALLLLAALTMAIDVLV